MEIVHGGLYKEMLHGGLYKEITVLVDYEWKLCMMICVMYGMLHGGLYLEMLRGGLYMERGIHAQPLLNR